MIAKCIISLVKILVWLRYRITVKGVKEIREKGDKGILFIPNHPAMVDPVIVVTRLFGKFRARPLAKETEIDIPVIGWIAKKLHTIPIADVRKIGKDAREGADVAITAVVEALSKGDNVILYPAGKIYRSKMESLGANSAVEKILEKLPDLRIVQVRTRGLWGSSFSFGDGESPETVPQLKKSVKWLFFNCLFFARRRNITVDLYEPADLPRKEDRVTINRFLEGYYNENAPEALYVPHTWWEKGGVRALPEPDLTSTGSSADAASKVSPEIRVAVEKYLKECLGVKGFSDNDELASELGMDSLARIELGFWLEMEYGCPVGDADALKTVGDVMLAAANEFVSKSRIDVKKVDDKWFATIGKDGKLEPPKVESIAEAFLHTARKNRKRVVIADQNSGVKTYQDLVMGVMALKREIQEIPGDYVAVMLPATVAATTTYLAVLFAGKIPVMLNWTVGKRNLEHAMEVTGAQKVLTVRPLVSRLSSQGVELGSVSDSLMYLEDIGSRITLMQKIKLLLASKGSWRSLEKVILNGKKCKLADLADETAAVLFTSGSENLPKAVPLSHRNIMTNLKDVCEVVHMQKSDRMIGMLPPFHSFGLCGNIVLPVCTAMPVVYHSNPTEGSALAQLIDAYKLSMLLGTPTFLNGVLRAGKAEQLETLRLSFVGAEKCPESVLREATKVCPEMIMLEGYGITECSPVVSVNSETENVHGSIGKVLPSVEHVIVHAETNERVPTGAQGMMLVRGASIFDGYLKHSGASPFVDFEDKQWYKTGDLVSESESGIITFKGRLKRFIKLGGEMVSLPAIEDVLAKYFPATDDGPILAVESLEENDKSEVVLVVTGSFLERESANQYIKLAGLSPLHNVRKVIVVDQIPLLGSGKTDYRSLKKVLQES